MGQSQADAGSFLQAAVAKIDFGPFFKNAVLLFHGYAGSRITNGDAQPPFIVLRAQHNLTFDGAELDGIIEQLKKDLLQSAWICLTQGQLADGGVYR